MSDRVCIGRFKRDKLIERAVFQQRVLGPHLWPARAELVVIFGAAATAHHILSARARVYFGLRRTTAAQIWSRPTTILFRMGIGTPQLGCVPTP